MKETIHPKLSHSGAASLVVPDGVRSVFLESLLSRIRAEDGIEIDFYVIAGRYVIKYFPEDSTKVFNAFKAREREISNYVTSYFQALGVLSPEQVKKQSNYILSLFGLRG